MSKKKSNQYTPNYLVLPGEILEEYLLACCMTPAMLSLEAGITPKTINGIIKGKLKITQEIAQKLGLVFGNPAQFWLNLESQYQANRLRLERYGCKI